MIPNKPHAFYFKIHSLWHPLHDTLSPSPGALFGHVAFWRFGLCPHDEIHYDCIVSNKGNYLHRVERGQYHRPKFLKLPMSTCCNGYMVNNINARLLFFLSLFLAEREWLCDADCENSRLYIIPWYPSVWLCQDQGLCIWWNSKFVCNIVLARLP